MAKKFLNWPKKYLFTSGFIATMFGVLTAFILTGIYDQWRQNETTKTRLHLTVLESLYNSEAIKELFKCFADETKLHAQVKHVRIAAATTAYQDSNIMSVLLPYQVSLLGGYISDLDTLNRSIDFHQSTLESGDFESSVAEKDIRALMLDNAVASLAVINVLCDELNLYFEKDIYDFGKIDEMKDRIDTSKEILNNASELYDFFYSTYKTSKKEKLLEFLKDHPEIDKFKEMPQEELAKTYCEMLVRTTAKSIQNKKGKHEIKKRR